MYYRKSALENEFLPGNNRLDTPEFSFKLLQ